MVEGLQGGSDHANYFVTATIGLEDFVCWFGGGGRGSSLVEEGYSGLHTSRQCIGASFDFGENTWHIFVEPTTWKKKLSFVSTPSNREESLSLWRTQKTENNLEIQWGHLGSSLEMWSKKEKSCGWRWLIQRHWVHLQIQPTNAPTGTRTPGNVKREIQFLGHVGGDVTVRGFLSQPPELPNQTDPGENVPGKKVCFKLKQY